jgi:seryl-tRNA synthetase
MRGEDVQLVDELLKADDERRAAISTFEKLRAEQKSIGKEVAKAQGDDKQKLIARTKELAAEVKNAQKLSNEKEEAFDKLMKQLPNLVFEDVPVGGEDDLIVIETHGTPRDFEAEGFKPRDHEELGKLLGAIDIDRASKVCGSRFYFLTGQGAQLEFAIVNLAIQKALQWGFTPIIPPALVKPSAMDGTGFLGQAAQDVYYLPADDMYLVGTSEVALAAYHSDEILEASTLPRHYVGYSPCFRREAGSYGKDTKGIFRVHWFDKVEMFVYCKPEDSVAEHHKLLEFEKDFLTALELPFEVLDVASGDLGMSAARKYDCYAWFPGQGRYREVTSTSNCTEFQARRLNVRYREGDVKHVATLNGTLAAIPRLIIALLENHQQADGSVKVPQALQHYLGMDKLTPIQ